MTVNQSVLASTLIYTIMLSCYFFTGTTVSHFSQVTLDAEQSATVNELIPGAAVNTQEAFKFQKIRYKNQLFTANPVQR